MDILAFVAELPSAVHQSIYINPPSVLAIFRLLTPIAQQIVMRMLFVQRSTSASEHWVATGKSDGTRRFEEALEQLKSLNIISNDEGHALLMLNETFRQQLSAALLEKNLESFGKRSEESLVQVSGETLDRFATERWDSILHFMVGSRREERANVLALLYASGLMAKEDDTKQVLQGNLRITNKGFQFLLQDVSSQVWALLLQYAELSGKFGMDLADVLNFFFFLGNLGTGVEYCSAGMTASQLRILGDLSDFGLVYCRQKRSASQQFYPTRLANIFSSFTAPEKSEAISKRGSGSTAAPTSFIVIETNYRLYAYTNSPLQIAIISLFTELRCRFQNLITGVINRDSVRQALSHGITANQIIQFLSTHAHSQMKSKPPPVIPPTIIDQISLWEMERNRLKVQDCYLYKDFTDQAEFDKVLEYAKQLKVACWWTTVAGGKQPLMIAIREEGHQLVKAYTKSLLAAAGSK